jgi:hypothetical protein
MTELTSRVNRFVEKCLTHGWVGLGERRESGGWTIHGAVEGADPASVSPFAKA